MDKPWKAFERHVAQTLGTNRIPVLGKEDADVIAEPWWIDCKLRKQVPLLPFTLMGAAEELGYNTVIADGVGLLRLPTLVETRELRVVNTDQKLPQLVLDWLAHIEISTPNGFFPLIAMQRPGLVRDKALVVMWLDTLNQWADKENL